MNINPIKVTLEKDTETAHRHVEQAEKQPRDWQEERSELTVDRRLAGRKVRASSREEICRKKGLS